jgi:serine protease
MRQPRLRISVALIATISLAAAAAGEFDGSRHEPTAAHMATARLIVKLRETADASRAGAEAAKTTARESTPNADVLNALAARERLTLRAARAITARLHVIEVAGDAGDTTDAMLARLRDDPAVEYAEPDRRRFALALPDDTDFVNQWVLQDVEVSAIDATGAWDTTKGSTGLVIADIDTGVRYEHPDLGDATRGGRLLPGYDFIAADPGAGTEFLVANDGNGRDDDPSDPGDWVDSDDVQQPIFNGCALTDSSWHGTRVAGILGALTDNARGVAGVTWDAWILPVRALGKCGGYDSDIIAGMLWAGGLTVSGVPANPYPARVENLSLGAVGDCPASYVDAIDELTTAGVLIVAAAGNEGGPVDSPANCPGVVAVAGVRHAGTKVGFSSLGPEIALSAPAGNCVNTGPSDPCLFSIDTTSNAGTTIPGASIYTDEFNINVGTSFATPIVAGMATLMASVNDNLTPAQLTARLQEGAQPFPNDPTLDDCHVPTGPNDFQTDECNCTNSTCGAGLANASASVDAALRPITAVSIGAFVPGDNVTLDASGSAAACGQSVTTYAWEVVSGTAQIVSGANESVAVVQPPGSGSSTVRLTITDDAGREDTADVVMAPTSATTTAPADAGDAACPTDVVIAQPPIDVTASPHVGEDLQKSITVALGVAPSAPQDVTVTVDDGSVALGSDDATQLGADTLVVSSVDDAASHTLFVQGLAAGTATLTVSAEGFEPSTETITVDPSGFVLTGGNVAAETTGANEPVPVGAARLDAGTLAFAESQPVRPGVSADVTVTSSNAAAGTIVGSPVTFDANTSSVDAQFDPAAEGSSTIAVETPAGFDTPSTMQSVTATVTAPASGSGSGSGGGGGGGALDLLTLGALLAAFARRLQRMDDGKIVSFAGTHADCA